MLFLSNPATEFGASNNAVSVYRAGNITVPGTSLQAYKFYMDSDDGSQLYIDGKLLISHGGSPLCCLCSAPIPINNLQHSLKSLPCGRRPHTQACCRLSTSKLSSILIASVTG